MPEPLVTKVRKLFYAVFLLTGITVLSVQGKWRNRIHMHCEHLKLSK